MTSGFLASWGVLAVVLSAAPGGSEWSNDYGEALRVARASQRPLLVVLDKPGEPEQRMHHVVFRDDSQSPLLRPYVLCHVDVSTPYGQKVAEAFGVAQFPFTAIVDKTGSVLIYKQAGRLSTQEWNAMLVSHENGARVPQVAPRNSGGGYFPTMRRPANCFT